MANPIALSHYAVADYSALAEKAQTTANRWDLAIKVSVVAFSAIAITTVTLVGVYAPSFFLVAVFSFLNPKTLEIFHDRVIRPMQENHESNKIDLEAHQGTEKKFEHLRTLTNGQLFNRLQREGVNINSINSFSLASETHDGIEIAPLRKLMARYEYWKETAEKTAAKANELFREAGELMKDPSEENVQKATLKRLYAYKIQQTEFLPAKVRAAYLHYVLKNPTEQREISDFGRMHVLPYHLRAQRIEYDHQDPYFEKNDGTQISRDDIASLSPQELSETLFS